MLSSNNFLLIESHRYWQQVTMRMLAISTCICIWVLVFSTLFLFAAAVQQNTGDSNIPTSNSPPQPENDYACNNNDCSTSQLEIVAAKGRYDQWLQTIRNASTPWYLVDAQRQEQGINGTRLPQPMLVLSVAQDGSLADFQRVQDAVNFVPENNTQRVIIFIRAGIYREKVTIPRNKPFITFQGEGKRSTIIRWHDKAYDVDKSGKKMGTLLSASVAVNSDDFSAANMSFENNARFPENALYRQAVALRVSGDRAVFLSCGFYGHQDTLYDHDGRHFFHNCTIRGSVDFVFGNGRSLYEKCHLHALGRVGALTAQNRDEANEPTGFAFVGCRITGEGRPYLGRAWGNFSRVVYVRSVLESDLDPEAWSDFGHPLRKSTAFYGMYECTGNGAVTAIQSGWTKELTYEEARPFLDRSFIDASYWLRPYTAVYIQSISLSHAMP